MIYMLGLLSCKDEWIRDRRPRANPASGQSGTQTQERRIASLTQWPLMQQRCLLTDFQKGFGMNSYSLEPVRLSEIEA